MTLETKKDVKIFEAGTHHKGTAKEVTFTEADLVDIVANFKELSKGPKPKYLPFLKVGKYDPHVGPLVTFAEGNPAWGWPRNVRKKGKDLIADLYDLEPMAAEWIDKKRFRTVSAEIDRPPNGEAHPNLGVRGAVLKAVSLLGANPPAVPGMYFSLQQETPITHHCFAETAMDRQGMLDFLAANGVDVSKITEAVGDDVLAELVKALQAAVDKAGGGADMSGGGAGSRLPSAVTMKFSEEQVNAAIEKFVAAKFSHIDSSIKAAATLADARAVSEKSKLVHSFCEQASKDKLLKPAEVECDAAGNPLPHTVLARLLRADHTKKHVFSEGDKQVQATELELQMDEIKKRTPYTFSEKVAAKGGGKGDIYQQTRDAVKAESEARKTGGKTVEERLHLLPARARR